MPEVRNENTGMSLQLRVRENISAAVEWSQLIRTEPAGQVSSTDNHVNLKNINTHLTFQCESMCAVRVTKQSLGSAQWNATQFQFPTIRQACHVCSSRAISRVIWDLISVCADTLAFTWKQETCETKRQWKTERNAFWELQQGESTAGSSHQSNPRHARGAGSPDTKNLSAFISELNSVPTVQMSQKP